jgi:hypothetical protein
MCYPVIAAQFGAAHNRSRVALRRIVDLVTFVVFTSPLP